MFDNSNNFKLDLNTIKKIFNKEYNFINNLLSTLSIPSTVLHENEGQGEKTEKKSIQINGTTKSRATTLSELKERIKNMQSEKKRMSYKEKLLKKGLKNRIKKKTKSEERNLSNKLLRIEKLKNKKADLEINEKETTDKTPKPIFNKDGKMVFSKFDFSNIGETKFTKKSEKDPKKILKNLEIQKQKLEKLAEQGENDKVTEIQQKIAWKNAIAKAEGQKVKDDPLLLKKTIKKNEQIKKSHQKKWQERQEGVKKAQEARQAKRSENIAKRKKEKKTKKLKQAAKRGKIIPGF